VPPARRDLLTSRRRCRNSSLLVFVHLAGYRLIHRIDRSAVTNPGGLRLSDFDELRVGTAGNRERFYNDVAVPFLGYNKPGAKAPDGVAEQFWRRGMQCSAIGSSTASRSTLERLQLPRRRLPAGATRRATTNFAATAPGRARVPSAPPLEWLRRCPAYSPSRGTCS
jgi:hypothetical protein